MQQEPKPRCGSHWFDYLRTKVVRGMLNGSRSYNSSKHVPCDFAYLIALHVHSLLMKVIFLSRQQLFRCQCLITHTCQLNNVLKIWRGDKWNYGYKALYISHVYVTVAKLSSYIRIIWFCLLVLFPYQVNNSSY
jgi:hypothetical protein